MNFEKKSSCGFSSLLSDFIPKYSTKAMTKALLLWLLVLAIDGTVVFGQQTKVIKGAVLIDGTGAPPIPDSVLVIREGRLVAVGPAGHVEIPNGSEEIDARGKFIIPGMMDANVHLFRDVSIEFIARYEDRLEELIEEGAQISLKYGVTTVFDSWGPLRPLMNVRDRINRGETPGSRVFVAGNIVGLSGPFGRSFNTVGKWIAPKEFVERVNTMFEEGTGTRLSWLPPEQVGREIRTYIGLGIDFLKYAVSGHDCKGCSGFPGTLDLSSVLLFTPEAQKAMVHEAHRAGIIAQTHTTSVESLRQAVEAGVDMLQHGAITGPIPIPESTIELMLESGIYCAVQPRTAKRLAIEKKDAALFRRSVQVLDAWDENIRRLIKSGVPLLLATDAGVSNPIKTEVEAGKDAFDVEHPEMLGEAHFIWFRAMIEKGMSPMQAIVAATRNNAAAYGKLDQFGTVEVGKLADLVVLNADPLEDIENTREIHWVIKEGVIVDREALPVHPLLTKP
jgi:imidazolonepropionase-like amidohydrolase